MASNEVDLFPDDDFPTNFEEVEEPNPQPKNGKLLYGPDIQRTPQINPQTRVQYNNSFETNLLECLLSHFHNNTKMSKSSKIAFAELMRIYSVEIITRAGEQAIKEGMTKITQEHLEKVLPQFLLDFN